MTDTPIIATERQLATRRRLAMGIVICAFIAFVLILISIPVGFLAYVRTATRPLPATVSTNVGTLAITQDNLSSTLAVQPGGDPTAVEPGEEVVTSTGDSGILQIYSQATARTLTRLQLYGNSRVLIDRISAPRYSWVNGSEIVRLTMTNGRMQVTVPSLEGSQRPFSLQISTPHATVDITSTGQYAIDVRNQETQLSVISGEAIMFNEQADLTLSTNQRGAARLGVPPEGPFDTERNLIANGNFSNQLATWLSRSWTIERDDQPQGVTELIELEGERALRFVRQGIGHADSGVQQSIGQDVTDYEYLQLVLTLRINEQSLGVCGTFGSECPLTVAITYADTGGVNRTWRQGFFANGEFSTEGTPPICTQCEAPFNSHIRMPAGQIFTYEIDMLESLARQGFAPPARIEDVTLIAAGHQFDVEVVDIALLGRE